MKRGFTLIEMVVILGVLAILAAILVPVVEKSINEARVARARNEVQIIAAGMINSYKNVCRWPNTRRRNLTPNLRLLYSLEIAGRYGGDGCRNGNRCKGWWKIIRAAKDTFTN